jgi:hypothetical protein
MYFTQCRQVVFWSSTDAERPCRAGMGRNGSVHGCSSLMVHWKTIILKNMRIQYHKRQFDSALGHQDFIPIIYQEKSKI